MKKQSEQKVEKSGFEEPKKQVKPKKVKKQKNKDKNTAPAVDYSPKEM